MPDDLTTRLGEIGQTGLSRWAGHVTDEPLKELQGLTGAKTFRQMASNDAVVAGILFAIEQLALQVSWRVEPASEDADDVARAEFVDQCLHDMSATWPETLREMLSVLVYGWSWHEVVLKRRGGATLEATRRSQYDDQRLGWRKWPVRAQETLDSWVFDDEGGVQAMRQVPPPDYVAVTIPIQRSLLFRIGVKRGNPEGYSLLRGAYRSWYMRTRFEELLGIGVERDLAGYPILTVDKEGPDIWSGTTTATQKRGELERFVVRIRRDQCEGAVLPWWADLKLLSAPSRRQFDLPGLLAYYDRQIALSMMADFLLIGHEKVGSFALTREKTELFALSVEACLHSLASVINRHAIPRLLVVNGWPPSPAPRLIPGEIRRPTLEETSRFLREAAVAGMPLFPDDALEAYLRAQARFPARVPVEGVAEKALREDGGRMPWEEWREAVREVQALEAAVLDEGGNGHPAAVATAGLTRETAKAERPKGECRWRTIGGRPVCITTGHVHGEAEPSPEPKPVRPIVAWPPIDPGPSGPIQRQLDRALATGLPREHLDGLARISWGVHGQPLPGAGPQAVAVYDPPQRVIRLTTGVDDQSVFDERVVLHELGHHVHLSKLTSEAAVEWAGLSQQGTQARLSAYARQNAGEHFAEAYRAYARGGPHRARLKAQESKTYQFMRRLMRKDDNPMLLPVGELVPIREWGHRHTIG
jgi:hypothetical protein